MNNNHKSAYEEDDAVGDGFGLSIGDLMAALMLVFVLLLAATLLQLKESFEARNAVAEQYVEVKRNLVKALQVEFAEDLTRWNAEIDPDQLLIRFNSNEDGVVDGPRFYWQRSGDFELTSDHREILDDFFPRYAAVLHRDGFRENITEIRIEGHTDESWYNDDNAYIGNMALSQNRTRSVLGYSLETLSSKVASWMRNRVTANGLSFSRLLVPDAPTDARNRRVEFRVITNAEEQLQSLLALDQQ